MPYFSVYRHLAPWSRGNRTAVLGTLLALSACGGGTGLTANTPTGDVSVAMTDGPSSDFDHAYVTVHSVNLHTNPTVVDVVQPGFVRVNLVPPITLDLNHLDNGALAALIANVKFPAGTYNQIRLETYPWDAALQSSASATNVSSTVNGVTSNAPLRYNSAVVEANGDQYPLEFPSTEQGLILNGSVTVRAGQSLKLAIELDAGQDIVRFRQGNSHAYTLNPTLHVYDLDQAGAITGRIDTSACAPSCSNFEVKAEQPSGSASVYQVARWTNVKADGSFTLYPVPVGSSNQTYDLVVRGRNAQTVIVQSVPVTAGSTPGSGATVLSTANLPMAGATEFTATTTATTPSAAWAQFYQTVSGKTYEIRFRQNDPFTGAFLAGAPEPLVNGSVQVGSYAAGGPIPLSPQAPQEGPGAYQVWFNAPNFTRTPATGTGNVNAAAATVTAPAALLQGSDIAALGTISGTLVVSNASNWTNGQLVLTRMGNIVNTLDVSNLVSSSTGGNFSVPWLPAGSSTQPFAAAYYYAYLRLWNTNAIQPNLVKIVTVTGGADLRTSASATLATTTLP